MSNAQEALIASILEPLRAEAERISGQIKSLEQEISERKAELKSVERVLRAADPTLKTGPKPGGGKPARASEDAVKRVLDVLQSEAERYSNSDGFTATDVHRDHGATLKMSNATVNLAVRTLHDQGLIRLMRRGSGGSRIYRLVVPGG